MWVPSTTPVLKLDHWIVKHARVMVPEGNQEGTCFYSLAITTALMEEEAWVQSLIPGLGVEQCGI